MTTLNKLPLDHFHTEQLARFSEFAGYRMPIQYDLGVKNEHLQTRNAVGLFDVSHMGQLNVSGPGATDALEKLVPAELHEMTFGQIRYSQFTLQNGGIFDDLMLTRWDIDSWGLIVNGARKLDDIAHLKRYLPKQINVDYLEHHCLIAIQGPIARSALTKLIPQAKDLLFMRSVKTIWENRAITLSCCGYTGEDGFEISIHAEGASKLAEALTDMFETKWVGLGARNSLRLEAGLCLHGTDLTSKTTPVEANLAWSIQKRRRADGGFLGADIILSQINKGVSRKRVGIEPIDGRTPLRDTTVIQNPEYNPIGEITSGGFGPTCGKPVAMGYLLSDFSAINTMVLAVVRGKHLECRVTDPVFFQQRYVRSI